MITQALNNKLNNKRYYYITFTVVFILSVIFLYSTFWYKGLTLIDTNDAWWQYYKFLVYYSDYLRNILSTLIKEHKLVIPLWEYSLGEGNDVIQTLHYYGLGDPFLLLSFICPTRYIHIYFDIILLLKYYFSGLAFSAFCIYKNHNKLNILLGAITYTFCTWNVATVLRFPEFHVPLIFFPLILIGIEKIINNERIQYYVVVLFLAFISNAYFIYIFAVFTCLYTILRLVSIYKKDIKTISKYIIKIGLASLLSLGLSAFIIVPFYLNVINSSRLYIDYAFHILYPLNYYLELPKTLLVQYYPSLGYTVPCILAIIYLLSNKGNKLLKIITYTFCIFWIFPVFGKLLNANTYVINRWTWVTYLLVSYVLVISLDNLLSLDDHNWSRLFLCSSILLTWSFIYTLVYSLSIQRIVIFFTLYSLLILLSPKLASKFSSKESKKLIIISVSIIISVLSSKLYLGFKSPKSVDEANSEIEINELETFKNYIADDTYNKNLYRVSGISTTVNANVSSRLSSTQFFWSISNKYISDFRREFDSDEVLDYFYFGYDTITGINEISGVKYFAIPKPTHILNGTAPPYAFSSESEITDEGEEEPSKYGIPPYGFSLIDDKDAPDDYYKYSNDYYLSQFRISKDYINLNNCTDLNSVEKQDLLVKTVFLNQDVDLPTHDIDTVSKQVDYKLSCGDGVTFDGKQFFVSVRNSTVTLDLDGLDNSETLVKLNNIHYKGLTTYTLLKDDEEIQSQLTTSTKIKLFIDKFNEDYIEGSDITISADNTNDVANRCSIYNNQYIRYNNRHNLVVNLGYAEQGAKRITISFRGAGIYKIDDLSVWCRPMDTYVEDVTKLQANSFDTFTLDTNRFYGTTVTDEKSLFIASIPFSTGWKAYIDGKETDVIQANIKYMAIQLPPGEHQIEFRYFTPYLKLGLIMSIVSIFIFILIGRFKNGINTSNN